MKLFHSPASPFVRKVMACAIARDIDDRIEKVWCDVHASPPDLLAVNPLGKIPTLIGADGIAYMDSPLICEYLDGIGAAPPLYPAERGARLAALRLHALGHGIMEAAVARRGESLRPEEAARTAAMARMRDAIARTLDLLEREADSLMGPFTIGSITVGCALGYLDFRFAAEPWRETHPKLAVWFESASKHRAFVETAPVAPK
ncbi:glutathione S-transferase [Elioraea tepidiphila]|uniref:glutathione S-transferase n=1 Tax=Elioraea tepidiphila TaxID=457934 RepID=UPI00036F204D|nr:glutathione S-transferase [Elioraea tepidiphila]